MPLSIDVSEVAIDLPTDTPEYLAERVTYWKRQRVAYGEGGMIFNADDVRCQSAFESGQDAARRDWDISECPYSPSDKQDSWIIGYLSASKPSDIDSANLAGHNEPDNDSLFRLTI